MLSFTDKSVKSSSICRESTIEASVISVIFVLSAYGCECKDTDISMSLGTFHYFITLSIGKEQMFLPMVSVFGRLRHKGSLSSGVP